MDTNAHLPLEDRIPTFDEVVSFDAGAAWDRLTAKEQRTIGMLAVRYGTIGQCDELFHESIEDARVGILTDYWTPEAQAAAVLSRAEVTIVEASARDAFEALVKHFDDQLWPKLWGWTASSLVAFAILSATVVNISAICGA